MKKDRILGVIDIGSHSIKMHIGEISRKTGIKKIEHLWVPVAIGKDSFNKGVVSNTTINEVITVLKNFKEVLASYQVQNYRCIATSSIREATNADVLIERVYKAAGIHIEVIEPIEETEVIYEGMKRMLQERYGFLEKNMLVFSIGGGSTQIVLQSKGRIVFSETHHIGTLKIIKDFDFSEKSYQFTLRPFSISFVNTMKRFPDVKKIDGFIAVNDDVTSFAQEVFSDYLVKGFYKIPRDEFNHICIELDNMSLDQISAKYDLNENMLKTTKVAMLMIGLFYGLTSASYIIIPDISTSFLMLYKTAQLNLASGRINPDVRENILSSARAIGMKYQFDANHAEQVARLSLELFDRMRDLYGFSDKERLFLETAALLHDIGSFVSASDHHKHSAQLIASSEILGLQNTDMKVIAQIARYHRKSPPKPAHSDYNELSSEDRLIVSRLSSILRIADALDNTHSQVVESLKVLIDGEKCEIFIKFRNSRHEYFDIIRAAVKKKSDLYESFFGIPVKLERLI